MDFPSCSATVMSTGRIAAPRSASLCSPTGSAANENRPCSSVTARRSSPGATETSATAPATAVRSPRRRTSPESGTVGTCGVCAPFGAARRRTQIGLEHESIAIRNSHRDRMSVGLARLENELARRRDRRPVERLAPLAARRLGHLDRADLARLVDVDGEDHLALAPRGRRGREDRLDEMNETWRLERRRAPVPPRLLGGSAPAQSSSRWTSHSGAIGGDIGERTRSTGRRRRSVAWPPFPRTIHSALCPSSPRRREGATRIVLRKGRLSLSPCQSLTTCYKGRAGRSRWPSRSCPNQRAIKSASPTCCSGSPTRSRMLSSGRASGGSTALGRFVGLLDQDPTAAQALAGECLREPPLEHAGYRELLARMPLVLRDFGALPLPARVTIRRHLIRSVDGMQTVRPTLRRAKSASPCRTSTISATTAIRSPGSWARCSPSSTCSTGRSWPPRRKSSATAPPASARGCNW